MNNQSFKKQISTATFFFILLFFAALDVECKELNNSYVLEKEPPIATCPENLTMFQAPTISVTNSICTGVVAAGGILGDAVGTLCPDGSRLQYRTRNSGPWLEEEDRPTYDQVTETNIYTRCICDMDSMIVSLENVVTTEPQACPGDDGCPSGLASSLAPPVEITNSSCMSGTVSGGEVSVPLTSCPGGNEIEYSLDNTSWSDAPPMYDQTNSITIYSRCICTIEMDGISRITASMSRSVVTTPGTCIACPSDLSNIEPIAQVTNSTCDIIGGTPSGGIISAPSTTCPTGTILEYSLEENTWSTSIPTYNQTSPLTIYTRCNCDDSEFSRIGEVTTIPGICPMATCDATLSSTTAPVVRITNSTCTAIGGTPSGGVLSEPTVPCPAGSTLEYSINDGATWSTALPSYSQSTAITIATRCLCDDDDSMVSIINSAMTAPGICPLINTTIPTMSQWGLIIFGLIILNIGVLILYRLEKDLKGKSEVRHSSTH